VYFSVTLSEENMHIAEIEGLAKRFKLVNSIATSNMVCFDAEGRIKKYSSPEDILQDFYHLRLQYYQRRKEYLADQLTQEWEKLNNKVRFISEIISGKFVVQNRKKVDILKDLAARGYKPFSKSDNSNNSSPTEPVSEGDDEESEDAVETAKSDDYDYLLSMQLWSLTAEKVERLKRDRDEKQRELDELLGTTVKEMWFRDLDAFEQEWAVCVTQYFHLFMRRYFCSLLKQKWLRMKRNQQIWRERQKEESWVQRKRNRPRRRLTRPITVMKMKNHPILTKTMMILSI
jgi:DNA topoisomerase-2